MGSALVVLFWLWVVVSLVILARRRLTGGRGIPAAELPANGAEAGSPLDHTVHPGGASVPVAAPAGPASDPAAGVPSPAPADPPPPEPTGAVRSVAEALTGVQLPCDLAPLVGSSDPDPTHVVFTTTGYAPAEVGTRVGDELERLGSELTPLDATTVMARRGSARVEVHLHPDTSAVLDGGQPRFPTAAAGSVAVEFFLR